MMYVFGYGSLVSAVTGPVPATLAGWRPSWNVGSDTSSHPEREFRDAAGRPYDGVVAVLGIEPSPGGVCPGAVFAVDADALPALDRRERNYERRDVTDLVDWPGKPRGCLVFTYVPRPEALRRLVDAGETGREVVVRSRYLALCRSVPVPPFPLRDLTQHVRLS
ncbi:gamma-glutamylcyclotransferase family protein [Virgisporangium aurantiacum]